MIGLVIAIFIGLAALIAIPGFLGNISQSMAQAITFLVKGILLIAIALLPVIAVVLILSLYLSKESRISLILFGSVYALLFYFLISSSGVQNQLIDLINNTYVGSWIPISEVKEALSVISAMFLSALDSVYFLLTKRHIRGEGE